MGAIHQLLRTKAAAMESFFPPALPPWEGMHPIVIHLPIALLAIAPLFVLLGIIIPKRGFTASALLLMLMGTAGAWLATNTGDAAYDVMDQAMSTDDWDFYEKADEAAQLHQEMSETARNMFTGLTALFALGLAIWGWRESWLARVIPQLILMLLWAPALAYLGNAAHIGGELVHHYGVKAVLAKEADGAPEEEPADEEATTEPAEMSEPEPAEAPAEPEAVEVKPAEPSPDGPADDSAGSMDTDMFDPIGDGDLDPVFDGDIEPVGDRDLEPVGADGLEPVGSDGLEPVGAGAADERYP